MYFQLYQLSTIHFQLSTINYQLSTINYQPSTISTFNERLKYLDSWHFEHTSVINLVFGLWSPNIWAQIRSVTCTRHLILVTWSFSSSLLVTYTSTSTYSSVLLIYTCHLHTLVTFTRHLILPIIFTRHLYSSPTTRHQALTGTRGYSTTRLLSLLPYPTRKILLLNRVVE